jgi:pyruvate dehydrogenase E2 component (dihydrolipoamide acetyltransferase)
MSTNTFEFKLPDIGEGVAEGEIVEWHVKVGDNVKEDQPLVEVMTDKATVTITSPKTGTIVELRAAKGQVVKVHSVLVVYALGAGAASTAATSAHAEGPAATAVGDIKDVLPGMGSMIATAGAGGSAFAMASKPSSDAHATPAMHGGAFSVDAFRPAIAAPIAPVDEYSAPNGKALATPATRKLARDLGVEITKVRPSAEHGRVTKEDVRNYVLQQQARARSAPVQPVATGSAFAAVQHAPAPSAAKTPDATAAQSPVESKVEAQVKTDAVIDQLGKREDHHKERAPVSIAPPSGSKESSLEERVPFSGLRRKIAEKMHTSVSTAAHFTFVEECDCTALKALRERLKPKAERAGVKLTYLPFIAKAVVAALKKHPILNTALDESTNELVYRKYYNLGVATATDKGLIVPVVKGADRLSLLETSKEIERVSTAARMGKASLDDLQGSTFTITSLGAQGGLFATPIINFPEVAILGVHQMKEKPVVRDGQIVIGSVMLLSLSFDHRIIDGHIGAAFAYEIINYLQDPDRLLLEL